MLQMFCLYGCLGGVVLIGFSAIFQRRRFRQQNLLMRALKLDQQFNDIGLTHAESDKLEQWELDRKTVECLVKDYLSMVSHLRECVARKCRTKKEKVGDLDRVTSRE